jgi:hypothetical protein
LPELSVADKQQLLEYTELDVTKKDRLWDSVSVQEAIAHRLSGCEAIFTELLQRVLSSLNDLISDNSNGLEAVDMVSKSSNS